MNRAIVASMDLTRPRAASLVLSVASVLAFSTAAALTEGCGSLDASGLGPSDSGTALLPADASLGDASLGDASPGDASSLSPEAGSGDASHPDGGAPDATMITEDDASTPNDAAPQAGLSWPVGASFPIFAAADQLDVGDLTGDTEDRLILFTTLEGLVNRTQPRIYFKDAANDTQEGQNTPDAGDTFWLSKFPVPLNPVSDPMTLITKYASEIAGIVIYDPNVVDTINLAITIAGVQGGIVASPTLAATLTAAPYNLKTLVDVTTLGLTTNIEVYDYELTNYAPLASNRIIFGHDPTNAGMADCLIDYAIATQGVVVWLDSTQPNELDLLSGFLANLEPSSPYLGWWVSEPSGVGATAQYHVPVFAADWSRNLSAFGGIHVTVTPPTPPPPPALDTTKAYVAIFMSDGDNLQENEHLIPLKWADPNRGQVPISWTTQPATVDVAPIILDYYSKTATTNDVLVSGPSGLGYTYPQRWTQTPGDSFAGYAFRSANYLERAGLNVITVWNNGVLLTQSPQQASDYATYMPGLLGVTDQLGTGGSPQLIGATLPILVFASGYAATEADLENGIQTQLAGWNHSGPLFVAVQGDMNQGAMTPTAFLHVQQYFAAGSPTANPDVVFVRGDHLFQLIREQNGLTMYPSFSDAGPPTMPTSPADGGDAAASCLLAGTAGNSYAASCGGNGTTSVTAAEGNVCTVGVVGQSCLLQCGFCNAPGGVSAASTLVLPCTQPIANCCGVLTCGGCGTCN
jgi:GxGYxY sequence motif in domain of unknown function N-terminal/GxGYxYP putative glycoside hydrolase C-terminal domain